MKVSYDQQFAPDFSCPDCGSPPQSWSEPPDRLAKCCVGHYYAHEPITDPGTGSATLLSPDGSPVALPS